MRLNPTPLIYFLFIFHFPAKVIGSSPTCHIPFFSPYFIDFQHGEVTGSIPSDLTYFSSFFHSMKFSLAWPKLINKTVEIFAAYFLISFTLNV